MDLLSEPHGVHHHLQVQIVLVYVEPQLVQDHLQLVLELPVVRLRQKLPSENGMREDLIPTDPVHLFQLQTSSQKINRFMGKVFALDIQRDFFNIADQLEFCAGSPRSIAVEEFIEDEAKCPDVALARVGFAFEDLKGHVEGGADSSRDHLGLTLHLFGEAKVSQLQQFSFFHDVGGLEVAMDDALFDECQKAIADLFEHIDSFGFLVLIVAFDIFG